MTDGPGPSGPAPDPGDPDAAEVGTRAPDFTARNQHGQDVTLSALRGGPVVLLFYPWAFSGICTAELGTLRDDLGDYQALGARVLGISCDPMFALRAFAEAERLSFDLLTDHWPHGAIAGSYGVFDPDVGVARRASFVLDAEGLITWRVLSGLGQGRDLAAQLKAVPIPG